jgi:aminoglycoside 6'-N-acetyltransferase I
MQIHALTKQKLDDYSALMIDVYHGPPWNQNWAHESAKKPLSELFDMPRFLGFEIFDGGKLIGCAFCREKTWWTQDELFVEELFIRRCAQRKGYGTALLNYLEQYVMEKNLAGITLLTDKNMPALKFYKKHGFSQAGHVSFMYKEISRD